MYFISNSKFEVRDKKIFSCKRKKNYNNNNTYIHKMIVFYISVTSEIICPWCDKMLAYT